MLFLLVSPGETTWLPTGCKLSKTYVLDVRVGLFMRMCFLDFCSVACVFSAAFDSYWRPHHLLRDRQISDGIMPGSLLYRHLVFVSLWLQDSISARVSDVRPNSSS